MNNLTRNKKPLTGKKGVLNDASTTKRKVNPGKGVSSYE